MIEAKSNFSLRKFTTIRIGGPAKYFVTAKTERDLINAIAFAKEERVPWYLVGDGSNLIVSDRGFKGVVIQNKSEKFSTRLPDGQASSDTKRLVTVGAGNNLLKLIFKLDGMGFAGMERMAGIPGTVGGAIYGCAGAYGQEIKDVLLKVRVFDGKKFFYLSKNQCQFGYRDSRFKKHKNLLIVEVILKLGAGDGRKLVKISPYIIKIPSKKKPCI